MRKVLLTAALTFVALAPARAPAQNEDEGASDEAVMPEGGATVSNEAEEAAPSRPATPGARHTVEKGDTLWDLSQKYLGSPWYWPKVWSYNPEIANPHWIFPGNLVRFSGTGEEVPTQVEVGQPETPEVEESEAFQGDRVQVVGQIGYRPKNSVAVASPGFITSNEVEEAGRIVGSFSEAAMLRFPDHIYVQFAMQSPRLGETYVVFRSSGEVLHPTTNRPIGYMTQLLAEVRVVRLDKDKRATVQVVKQYADFGREDLVGPMAEPIMRFVAARPNERDVKDVTVVANERRFLSSMAEHSSVIMDKGSDDGVKAGNVFTIWRQHDALPQQAMLAPHETDEVFPREDIAQCVAYEVKAKATICLMSHSLREVVRGDHAEIRAAGSRRAAR